MILIDTSVWIDHLRDGNAKLDHLADQGLVICHPAIIGELACGTFSDRVAILHLLRRLPQVMEAEHEEVLDLIQTKRLMGSGIGWLDAHILASALLSESPLWTFDKRLAEIARKARIHAMI